MTTNIGLRTIQGSGFGFSKSDTESDYETMKKKMIEEAHKLFNPEFINRIDDPIVFHSLTRNDVLKIIDLQLHEVVENLSRSNTELKISKQVKELIFEEGYKPQYGARPLRRAIQTMIEDQIAEKILEGLLTKGYPIELRVKNKKLSFWQAYPQLVASKPVTVKE